MSGFFGIFSPTDKSIDLEAFEQMRKATELEGFDGMETHVEDNIAMGHLMLRVSPESACDKQPLKSSCGNYLLVGHFRLDYRDELGDKLGLIQSELESTPDSVLVMMAYQKWKEKCVNHLEGDWAFALVDLINSHLFLAKDQTGHSAVYYRKENDSVYFSSASKVLSSLLSMDLNVNNFIINQYVDFDFSPAAGTTFIENIFYVKGAHYLVFDNLYSYKEFKYWNLHFSIMKYKFEDDYLYMMHSLFSLAVKSRSNSSFDIGVFLSSGLDSSAVTFYAATQLRNQKKRLKTYTSYPFYLDCIDSNEHHKINEAPLVKGFTSQFQNVDSEILCFPNVDVLSDLEKSQEDIIYPFPTINTFWINGILKISKESNSIRVLNGQMGNSVISWDGPGVLSDLLLRFKFFTLIKDIFQIMKSEKKNFFVIFYHYVLRDFIRFFLVKKEFLDFVISPKKYTWLVIKQKQSEKIDFGFVKKSALSARHTFYFDSKKMRMRQFFSSVEFAGMRWYSSGHSFAVETSDPTSDIRLVNFSFSLPENLFFKNGEKKYIYKKWMKNNLTKETFKKKLRIMQSGDFGYRLLSSNLFKAFITSKGGFNNGNSNKLNLTIEELVGELNSIIGFSKKRALASKLLKQISVLNFLNSHKINS